MNPQQICVYISPTTSSVVSSDTITGLAWPATLVVAPGQYQYNDRSYALTNEGLYKLHVPSQNTTNLVVYNGDVKKLMATLSMLIVPGQTEDYASATTIHGKLFTSRARVLCGNTANFIAWVCSQKGIPCRTVRSLRSGTPNNFYDGHVMNEVWFNGQWNLIDVNLGFEFINQTTGANLNHKQACLGVQSDTNIYTDLHFMKDRFPSEQHTNSVYHHSSTVDIYLNTPDKLKNFQKDVMSIPGIDYGGLTYFWCPPGTESRSSWILGLNSTFRVVDETTFNSMFY